MTATVGRKIGVEKDTTKINHFIFPIIQHKLQSLISFGIDLKMSSISIFRHLI